jgi:hypothetical protein
MSHLETYLYLVNGRGYSDLRPSGGGPASVVELDIYPEHAG